MAFVSQMWVQILVSEPHSLMKETDSFTNNYGNEESQLPVRGENGFQKIFMEEGKFILIVE